MDRDAPHAQLLVRCGAWLCGLPLSEVIETMRPLPLQAVSGAPVFVRGLSVIRGELVPVVALAHFFGRDALEQPRTGDGAALMDWRTGRLVLARAGERRLAIAVDEVVRVLPHGLPGGAKVAPLLDRALPEPIAALATLDGAALALLASTNLLSEEAWRDLAASLRA